MQPLPKEASVTVDHHRVSYLFHLLDAKQTSVVRWANNSTRWKYLKMEIAYQNFIMYWTCSFLLYLLSPLCLIIRDNVTKKRLLSCSYNVFKQCTLIHAHIPPLSCEVKRIPVEENVLWQEAPVHRPLKQKLTAQIKRPAHITYRIHQEEGQT